YISSVGNYLGYFDASYLVNEEIYPEDWVKMGDRFRISAEGWGFVEGRTDDLIIKGGTNIALAEVEATIKSHARVEVCKVVGVRSQAFGQEVAAAVVGNFSSTTELSEIIGEHCSNELAKYKVPTRWLLISELPRNANDK